MPLETMMLQAGCTILLTAACAVQSSSRANSRKRICRENSTGSDATQGLAPSRSGSLPAALAPYVPVPSAFGKSPFLITPAASLICLRPALHAAANAMKSSVCMYGAQKLACGYS